MTYVMTMSEFHDRADRCSLREQGEPTDHPFLGWIPVTWGSTPESSLEEADDWREFIFYHSGSESEALAEFRAAFGELAEIEAL